MGVVKLDWKQLERLVASRIWSSYTELKTVEQKKQFCIDIKEADPKRHTEYDLPRSGEAYARWFHLLRTDNICVALQSVHDKLRSEFAPYALHKNVKVLDIGSGTGSGAMAITYMIGRQTPSPPQHLHIVSVEPSSSMRRMATSILDAYFAKINEGHSHLASPPFSWEYWQEVSDLQSCAQAQPQQFDLILFSHTFCEYKENDRFSPEKWKPLENQVVQIITNHLGSRGIAVFLTPHEGVKEQQRDSLIVALKQEGMTHFGMPSIPKESRFATLLNKKDKPEKHSPILIELTKRINQECIKHSIGEAFGTKGDDRPYYHFSCDVDVFFKNEIESV